ncbi:MAG: hypothetical protein NZ740_08265 [Kiritimatiellae bacterium]|nr:hypothetical protein [Kiritimatiellia bacterium]MDW8459088.1 hypothetical protein [Verrucomicrobiota bacterium]
MHPMHNQMSQTTQNPSGPDYADRDIPSRAILRFVGFVGLFTVGTLLLLRGIFVAFDKRSDLADRAVVDFVRQHRVLPPEPRLQVDEPATWAQEYARQRASISEYAWVDERAGIVRIPVERAMEILAERGLPARNAEDTP